MKMMRDRLAGKWQLQAPEEKKLESEGKTSLYSSLALGFIDELHRFSARTFRPH